VRSHGREELSNQEHQAPTRDLFIDGLDPVNLKKVKCVPEARTTSTTPPLHARSSTWVTPASRIPTSYPGHPLVMRGSCGVPQDRLKIVDEFRGAIGEG
jgi:hypothetical protein